MIPEAAARAIGRPLAAARRVAGGDINDAWLLELEDGTRAFVKSRAGATPGEYATEAAALRWLGEVAGGLAVPRVLAVGDAPAGDAPACGASPRFLALAWIDEGRLGAARRGGARARARARPRRRRAGVRRIAAGRAARRAAARRGRAGAGDRGRLALVLRPSTGSRRSSAPRATAARSTAAARARSSARSSGCRSWPGRPSRRPGCTATSGAATCSPDAGGRPVPDRPGGVRRPPRGRPRDAAAVRRAVAAHAGGLRGGAPARARPRAARPALAAVPAARPRGAVRRLLRRRRRRRPRAGLRHDAGMDLGIEGRTAVVTGASRGIGASVAELLEADGVRVVPVSRSEGIDVTAPDAAERIAERAARPRRHPRQQRRDLGGPPARGADRRRLLRGVRAQRDGAAAADAPLRAGDGRARLGPDRQRDLERRQAAVADVAGVLGREGRPALALAALRRPLGGARGARQRRRARPDRHAALARPGRARRADGRARGHQPRRRRSSASRARSRSAASASPTRSRPSSSSSAPSAPRGSPARPGRPTAAPGSRCSSRSR